MQFYQPFASPARSKSSSIKISDEERIIGSQSPRSTTMLSELAETSYTILNDSSNGVLNAQNKVFECTTDMGKYSLTRFHCQVLNFLLGLKPTQEDRIILAPEFFDQELALCAVFDGTSGDAASNFSSKYLPNFLCNTQEMQSLITFCKFRKQFNIPPGKEMEFVARLSSAALRKAFLNMDQVLLHHLKEESLHFTACTTVSALVWKNMLTIAHLGDSRACIYRTNEDGSLHPEWLTVDHKPNNPEEQQRINAQGGSLSWTHGKPYLRGPDFLERYNKGEHPKKLNFSRGFGGKDLKPYGFSADPDIKHFEITSNDKFVVLATDGLWDVLSANYIGHLIAISQAKGLSATDELVKAALEEMPDATIRDNISVIVISL